MDVKYETTNATFLKKPSIFELIAVQNLSDTLQPAFEHIIRYLVSRNPLKYSYLINWLEELYLCFNLLLQHYYLKLCGAVFSEHFYNLKRIPSDSSLQSCSSQLSNKHVLLSLLFHTIFPYIKNKLKIIIEKIENEEEDNLKNRFLMLYKIFHVLIESVSVIFYLAYMVGYSETHSFFLHCLRLTLVYSYDSRSNDIFWKMALTDILRGDWKKGTFIKHILGTFIGKSLEMCTFFIQFLNWWHSKVPSAVSSYPIPPPPHTEMLLQNNDLVDVCAICKRTFQIPCAISVSGYVCCFPCVQKLAEKSQKHPSINLPYDTNSLFRLYE